MALSAIGAFARRHDPDRFLCALFVPAPAREAVFTLIAFNHELARAREAVRLPPAALLRLQWWREVVEAAASGAPARRHEVAAPLHAAITAGQLAPDLLLALVEAREVEAEPEGVADAKAFEAYLNGTAGGVAVAIGACLGATTAPVLREAGALYGLAGVLRGVPALARQGRCLLPGDRMLAHGLDPASIATDPERARALVSELAGAAQDRALVAGERLASLPRTVRAAGLVLTFARRDLRGLARRGTVTRGFADRLAVIAAGIAGRP